MTAKCIGCGLHWIISINARIQTEGYTCPHCDSRLKAGETMQQIRSRPKSRTHRKER